MTRVMVVGGAGVFGSRLVDGLAATTDACVIVAGRNRARCDAAARAARERYPTASIETAAIDIHTTTPADLRTSGARIVVDAAGPFQGAEPRLAKVAIAAQLDYLDLADARDFVARFPELDDAARAAGVVAVTGMSSTPALSHAVLDSLTVGWQRIDRVEVGISPGNREPRGRSIVAAILAWAGQPLPVFVGGAWVSRRGWSGTITRPIGDLGIRELAFGGNPRPRPAGDPLSATRRRLVQSGAGAGYPPPWTRSPRVAAAAWLASRPLLFGGFDPADL